MGEYFAYLRNSDTRPKGVVAAAYSSDYMSPSQRASVEAALGVPPLSLYGQTERAVMALSCEHGDDHHLFSSYGYMEILDRNGCVITKPGVIGQVVGTPLWPRATALVRYATGDRASWSDGPCRCGRTQPRFQLHAGRERDFLVDSGGMVWLFGPAVYEQILSSTPPGTDLQFYHPEPGILELRLSRTLPVEPDVFLRPLVDLFGEVFQVRLSSESPVRTYSGKRPLLVSNV